VNGQPTAIPVPTPELREEAWQRWGTWWLPIGPALVGAYAAVMVATIVVLEPLAALPDLTYAQITAELARAQVPVTGTLVFLVIWASLGTAASVTACAAAIGRRSFPATALVLQLGLLALGAPAYFAGSFDLGMNLADTFLIDGGQHSAVPTVLYGVSSTAVVALAVVGMWSAVAGHVRRRADGASGSS
jgi:hypothetical protein